MEATEEADIGVTAVGQVDIEEEEGITETAVNRTITREGARATKAKVRGTEADTKTEADTRTEVDTRIEVAITITGKLTKAIQATTEAATLETTSLKTTTATIFSRVAVVTIGEGTSIQTTTEEVEEAAPHIRVMEAETTFKDRTLEEAHTIEATAITKAETIAQITQTREEDQITFRLAIKTTISRHSRASRDHSIIKDSKILGIAGQTGNRMILEGEEVNPGTIKEAILQIRITTMEKAQTEEVLSKTALHTARIDTVMAEIEEDIEEAMEVAAETIEEGTEEAIEVVREEATTVALIISRATKVDSTVTLEMETQDTKARRIIKIPGRMLHYQQTYRLKNTAKQEEHLRLDLKLLMNPN